MYDFKNGREQDSGLPSSSLAYGAEVFFGISTESHSFSTSMVDMDEENNSQPQAMGIERLW